ncbi:hypothetical protein IGI04_023546 [Brassica rapa subsp. trilocularis]|uniref:Uncharacterized protein n=1 Tax=Brassica rapa subsp. trilocularis TaxID=1813537 RepID=A0ABQ7M6C8_BRACM|nr:hypothetical protein IGI04_023546 [Brassica rapa subsp. trilocularis]
MISHLRTLLCMLSPLSSKKQSSPLSSLASVFVGASLTPYFYFAPFVSLNLLSDMCGYVALLDEIDLRFDHRGYVVGSCRLIWKISEVQHDGGTYIFWTSSLLDLQISVLHGVERFLRTHVFSVFVYCGGFRSLHSRKSISGDVCTSVTTSGAS